MSAGHDTREVFLDARGNGRALRLTWHHESEVVVLSLWRDGSCAGTFRLPKGQVNEFIDALVDGLRDESTVAPSPVRQEEPGTGFLSWAFSDTPGRHATAG